MKTRAKVPIIMMGETGCGKTSLIKMLSLLKNKGEIRMKILNIHEGVGDDEIISFLEKTFKITDEEDKNLIKEEKRKYYETYFEDYKEKREIESSQKNNKKSNDKTIPELNKLYTLKDIQLYEKPMIYSNYVKTEESILPKIKLHPGPPIKISKSMAKIRGRKKNEKINVNKSFITYASSENLDEISYKNVIFIEK